MMSAEMSGPIPAPQSPPQRKRVSQACQPCGLKKVKCDGILPVCSPCRHKGVECTYGVSKRRARPSIGVEDMQRPRPSPSLARDDEVPRFHSINDQPMAYAPLRQLPSPIPSRQKALPSVSPEISTRLIQTYFNCLHPLWPILYKPLYASLDYASPTDMMPAALVAAIFAIASCVDKPVQYANMQQNTIVQRYPEPWQFFEDALDLMQYSGNDEKPRIINALTPSITNCQVLTILSLQQHGVAEYSRAALLCGLASAMAIELRLHRRHESNDSIQNEIHSRLWWNLYILEKMMSTEMGRPTILRSEETDCPIPSVSEADEFELMSFPSKNPSQQANQPRNISIKLRTISGLHSTIRLSGLMEGISREIYGVVARKEIRANATVGEERRIRLWHDLKQWERSMEQSSMAIDLSKELSSIPAVVTNYVVMWHGVIMLHRPFIPVWKNNPASSDQSMNPLDVCVQAANNICMVLEKYFDRLLGLPCDMVFSIFTAATTFLYQSRNLKTQNEETRRKLKLCVHWLSVLGKSWKSAGARHQILTDMYSLPQDLQIPKVEQAAPGAGPAQMVTPTPGSQQQTTLPRIGPNGAISNEHTPQPEDWSFLNSFGDSTDEFYELDVQFRGLLDSPGFELGQL